MQVQNRITRVRSILAMLLPLGAFVLQWLFWPHFAPFAWFLFYPTLFLSSWIGGLTAGLVATVFSTVLVWLYFIPPQFVILKETSGAYLSAFVFMGMGVLFSLVHKRLREANQRTADALRSARQANEQLQGANDQITRLYEKSRELDELKSQLFANVSHELRTPLTLILGPIGRRLADSGIGDEERRDLEVVERNARLLYRHVNDLLDVARLEARQMRMRYAEADLAALSRFVASHFESLAEEKGIRFEIETPEALSAEIDAEKCRRILFNLLSNAFKFTPDGGEVALNLAVEGDRAILCVQDSGPGIPAPLREAVFERFRQVEGGAERRYGGTGLGLAIVKEFVELQGGRVEIADAMSGGALFRVELPLTAPEGSEVRARRDIADEALDRQAVDELRRQAVPARSGVPEAAAGVPLVLVVEDNPDMNAFVAGVLGRDYRVVTAFDGQEGLAKALESRPDLIVCDVMMPRMSGEQMVEELRQRPEMAHVPIVMLTAKNDDALRLRMLREQVQDFLVKPFLAEYLLLRVNKLVTGRERDRRRFDTLVESMPSGVLLIDREGRVALVNATAERTFGYRRDELVGQPVEQLLPLPLRENHVRLRGEFLAHPEARPMGAGRDLFGLRKDGSEVPLEIGLAPVDTEDGPMILAAVIDITERKMADAALRESEANLRRAQALAQVGSWRLDIATDAMTWSEETYRIFGISLNAPVNRDTFRSCVHPDDKPRLKDAWHAALGGMPYNIEHRILAGGETKWVCGRAEVIPDAAGHPSIAYGAVLDITQHKYLEQCLQDAVHRKDEFLAMLAHELRNPLAPIRNAVEIMRAIGPSEPRLDWARDVIDRQVTHMTRMVDELLEISRIIHGKMALVIETVDLVDVVKQAVELSRSAIDSRQHVLAAQLPHSPVWIKGDGTRLSQVVANLLDNAAKYTPNGGHIALKFTTSAGEADISVADTGQGIAPELLPHLFEPFSQGERPLDRAQGGLGLGLTLVKNVVDLHDGRVEARSPGQGRGAEFLVRLPCLPVGEKEAFPETASVAVESAPLVGERVLLVDDNKDVLNSLAFLFRLKGYEVEMATDGPAALRLVEEFAPRVILLDIGLPGMDGYEVCRRVRAQCTEHPPLIIALTGYGEKKDIERAKATGFDHHLVKPADPEQLFALIDASQPRYSARTAV